MAALIWCVDVQAAIMMADYKSRSGPDCIPCLCSRLQRRLERIVVTLKSRGGNLNA